MLEVAAVAVLVLFAGWAYLLYRFHLALAQIDPALSEAIGKPSLFWTAFKGDVRLIQLICRRDLGRSRYAALLGQARVLRVWAVVTIAVTLWAWWSFAQAPAI